MKKKHLNSEKCMMQIVRMALGREKITKLPEDVDWDDVAFLSRWHNVSVLVADALAKGGFFVPEIFEHDRRSIGISFEYYLMAVQSLALIFRSKGLKMIVLKGLSLADNYPIPSHRGAGDIDIYVVDQKNKPAAARADEVLREFSDVDTLEGHHTHAHFKKMMVENHHWLIEHYSEPDENLSAMGDAMVRAITEGNRESTEYAPVHVPPATFNALFIMRHIYRHAHDRLKFRQALDWMLFVERHYDEVDWEMVEALWKRCGMTDFVGCLHGFLIRRMGMKREFCRVIREDERSVRMIERIIFYRCYDGRNLFRRAVNRYGQKKVTRPITGNTWARDIKEGFESFCGYVKREFL